MSQTLQLIQQLVARGEIRISEHGYDELAVDGIPVRDILHGVAKAVLVEDYPEYFKGPCVCTRVTKRTRRVADSRGVGNPQRRDHAGGCRDRLQAAHRYVVR